MPLIRSPFPAGCTLACDPCHAFATPFARNFDRVFDVRPKSVRFRVEKYERCGDRQYQRPTQKSRRPAFRSQQGSELEGRHRQVRAGIRQTRRTRVDLPTDPEARQLFIYRNRAPTKLAESIANHIGVADDDGRSSRHVDDAARRSDAACVGRSRQLQRRVEQDGRLVDGTVISKNASTQRRSVQETRRVR